MPSWKSRTEAQGWGTEDYALLLFLYNLGARASEAVHVAIEDSGVEPRTERISETPREKGGRSVSCHGSPRPLLQQSARRTTNQCATPQIRTQYTILEHSVPSRIALASELFSAAFLVLPFRLELIRLAP